MTSRNYFGKMNSTLGSVVPLAMFSSKGFSKKNNVLHVLINVPWVRLDEVKAVVHDDPADPVIIGLGAVVLVALASVFVACLTNKQVHWLYIYKNKIHLAPSLLHSCVTLNPNPAKIWSTTVLANEGCQKLLSGSFPLRGYLPPPCPPGISICPFPVSWGTTKS